MGINKLTKTEIADLLSASIRTISTWVNEGMPRNDDGTYDGPEVIRWFSVRLEDKISGKGVMLDVEGRRATNRWREARADREELELAKAKGLLISKDDVYTEWAAIVGAVMSSIEILADRLPPVLHGRKQVEMYEIISDEIWNLRDQLFRKGRYTTPPTYEPWIKNTGKEPVICPKEKPKKKKPAKRKSKRNPVNGSKKIQS